MQYGEKNSLSTTAAVVEEWLKENTTFGET